MSNLLLARSAQMGRHPLLPKEYQQVEYIESTGTQWIDTGVVTAHGTTTMEAFVQFIPNNKQQLLGQNSGWWWGINADNTYYCGQPSGLLPSSNSFDFIQYCVETGGLKTMSVNDVLVTSYSGFDQSGIGKNIWLFKINNFSNAYCRMKLKSFRIVVNGELARDFVPCYQKSNQTSGVFDLVHNQFYYNSSVAPFILGKNIH